MRTLAGRIVAVTVGITVACTTAATAAMLLPHNPLRQYLLEAKYELFPDPADPLRTEVPAQNKRVIAEIAELNDHPWAGTYRTAGIWPVVLSVAPKAGYTLYHGSGCGNCAGYEGAGSVSGVDGATLSLQLVIAQEDNTSSGWFGVDKSLHLVRWGNLLFAVPQSRMEFFCAEVSDGYSFPYAPFRCINEVADFNFREPPRPDGLPEVPREFERLILKQPISAHIQALDEWRRRPELDGKDSPAYDAVYTIDAGTDRGLAVGMRLFVEGERHRDRFDGRVERVDAHTARFQWVAFGDKRAWAQSLVGKNVSTAHPTPEER